MVEVEIERCSKIVDGNVIAIKKTEYVNGVGKKVVHIVEEYDISPEEIDQVIDVLSEKELEDVEEKILNLKKEMDDLKKEIEVFEKDKEFVEFKKILKSENSDKFFKIISKEKTFGVGQEQMLKLEKTKKDVLSWKQQFVDLKNKLSLLSKFK